MEPQRHNFDLGERLTVELLVKDFGKWTLGYAWVSVSLGQAATSGLALYARKGDSEPLRKVVFGIKEAIGFFADKHVPARSVGKLLAEATAKGDWHA